MKIKEVSIKNYRGVDDITLELQSNLNVFVGVNGAGKTTILDAIVSSLSWLVNRIQRENSSGRPIIDSNIKNGKNQSTLSIKIIEKRKNYNWSIIKTVKGTPIKEKSDLADVSSLASYFQDKLNDNQTLPVIAYYPINRVVETVSPTISRKANLNILDVYDNALGGKTNYQSFFEWFRQQDDILNEKAQSRTKWMIKNKPWIKRKTLKIISQLEVISKENGRSDTRFSILNKKFNKEYFIYEEPKFLLHELIEIIHYTEYKLDKKSNLSDVFHDIGYMLHRMSSISDSRKENLMEPKAFPFSVIERVLIQLENLQHNSKSLKEFNELASFIWETLHFSVLLSLWWLSEKGKKEIEALFLAFNPSKIRNASNAAKEGKEFINAIDVIIRNDSDRLYKATRNEGRDLKYVTSIIERFVPGYTNLRVSRVPRPNMLVDKDGETISLNQLSDGEKNLIALVGDIARRLSIANSNSSRPMHGEGIILIDEIDLHLHPSWQRLMVPQLTKLFPNCQFIITTHSPQVLSHVMPENIFILKNEKNVFSYSKAIESYGQNSDRILEDLLGVDARPTAEKEQLHKLFKLIQDGNLTLAKNLVMELNELIGDDPELVKAEVLIKRKEIIGK